MPTKTLDRLMFAQGGRCFFCKQPLPRSEASVEHLVANANGGSKGDDNCVAVCKAVNALLGCMSLKEKIRVILNQKGEFKCPNGVGNTMRQVEKIKVPVKAAAKASTNHDTIRPKDDRVALVLTNLNQRGKAKPRKLKTLTSTVASLFPKGISESELAELLRKLQTTGKVVVSEGNVTYAF